MCLQQDTAHSKHPINIGNGDSDVSDVLVLMLIFRPPFASDYLPPCHSHPVLLTAMCSARKPCVGGLVKKGFNTRIRGLEKTAGNEDQGKVPLVLRFATNIHRIRKFSQP